MAKKTYILFLIFSFLFSCSTQKVNIDTVAKKVKGTIYDETGILATARILVLNSNKNAQVRQTLTDWDGNFELEVKKGEILEINFVGYYSEEIMITDSNEYKIKLFWNDGSRDKSRQRDLRKLAKKNGGEYVIPD